MTSNIFKSGREMREIAKRRGRARQFIKLESGEKWHSAVAKVKKRKKSETRSKIVKEKV